MKNPTVNGPWSMVHGREFSIRDFSLNVTPAKHNYYGPWTIDHGLSTAVPAKGTISRGAAFLYDSLRLDQMGLSKAAFEYGIRGCAYLNASGKIENDRVLSIIDFSLPSYKKRLFIIDLHSGKLLFNTYVAHGVNSGAAYASHFSNSPESDQSSLGFYTTLHTYTGKNGYSLRLEGLDRGFNDNANKRDIVIHGAEYVSEDMIRSKGYIGRSWGCPALPSSLHIPIIDKIKDGTCLFIYGKDRNYLKYSTVLRGALRTT